MASATQPMLQLMDTTPKPTPEELAAAASALELEMEKLARGDGSSTPERVRYLSDLYEKMLWQAKDF